jgi:hypothetical protein
VKTWFVLAGLGVAQAAHAGEYADALAKSDKAAIATLKAKNDPAARCTLGAIYAKKNDLPRASLYLANCEDLPEEISADVAKANREVTKKLRDSDYSFIAVTSREETVTLSAEISAMAGDTFTTPATIWVKAGTYEITATDGAMTYKQSVTVDKHSRTSAVFETGRQKLVTEPVVGKADFTEENAVERPHEGSPKAVKRGSLMDKKYQGIAEGSPDDIADPLAVRAVRHAPRDWSIGARLGGGMFDDGAGDARAGAMVAATGRYALSSRYFLAARVDYSARSSASIDVLGASFGGGVSLVPSVALFAQLRGDVRLGDEMGVRTFGVSGVADLEVLIPNAPITAGVRFEQGLTTIAENTRDRALLLEVGVDWR